MTSKQFFTQLTLVAIATALALWGLLTIPVLAPYYMLAWASLAGFIGLSIIMFMVSRQSAQHPDQNLFTSSVLGFTFGKMMLSVTVILAYLKLTEPESKLFIIPFFTVYFIFTAFETYFMMRLGRTR